MGLQMKGECQYKDVLFFFFNESYILFEKKMIWGQGCNY